MLDTDKEPRELRERQGGKNRSLDALGRTLLLH